MATKKTNATKGKTVPVEDIDSISDIEGVEGKRTVPEGNVKIKILVTVRANFGAFNKGETVEVDSSTAQRLIDSGRAESCS